VRFLSNRSTGKMGFAVAQAAVERGHRVTLVAGPLSLPTPVGVERVDVVSARDMLAAVERLLPAQDALVMTAAVADWRPARVSETKLKKSDMRPVIELEPNPDILKTFGRSKARASSWASRPRPATRWPRPSASSRPRARPDRGERRHADGRRIRGGYQPRDVVAAGEAPTALPLQSKLDVGRVLVAWLEQRRQKASDRNDGNRREKTVMARTMRSCYTKISFC
jgi:hypothetical protein